MCGARGKFFCAVITSHSPDQVSKQEICRTRRTCLQLHAHITGQEGKVRAHGAAGVAGVGGVGGGVL